MIPYAELNGVSSLNKGLRLEKAELFVLPARSRERLTLPGRLISLEDDEFSTRPENIRLTFGAMDTAYPEAYARLSNAAEWLLSARTLRLWIAPDRYYTGAVEGSAEMHRIARRHAGVTVSFLCNPPCRQKAIVPAQPLWMPADTLPIPEQITASIQSTSKALTAAGALPAVSAARALPPALYLMIEGSWTTLTIGGTLNITQALSGATIFVDCEAEECYRIVSGKRTNVSHNGDYPKLPANGALAISGTAMNITARLLVVERG